jgi:hypothetical protein
MDEEERTHLWKLLRPRAEAGDRDALNILGSLYVDEALRLNDGSFLELAEKSFREAAERGHEVASTFLETVWPGIKEGYLSKIEAARRKQ